MVSEGSVSGTRAGVGEILGGIAFSEVMEFNIINEGRSEGLGGCADNVVLEG